MGSGRRWDGENHIAKLKHCQGLPCVLLDKVDGGGDVSQVPTVFLNK